MTKVMQQEGQPSQRPLLNILFDRSVLSTAIVAALSALSVLVLLGLLLEPGTDYPTTLWLMPLITGVIGALIGYSNRGERGGFTETVLQDYSLMLDQVVNGDLRARLELPALDANTENVKVLRSMGQSINRVLDVVLDIVRDVDTALKGLDDNAEAILAATARQISMGNEQDDVVTETTATVNEVRATVTETAERAQSVAETAQFSVDISRNGTEAVQETIEAMELIRRRVEDIADNILVLSEHTQQIGEIIATVNNLADQSRMLALNASVEAARAGEEGKGFAVVAMEVRNLADQNRDATVQVREILGEIQRATNSAVMVTEEGSKGVDSGQTKVNKAGDAIQELSKAIEEAALAAMQIAASTRQQTIGMDQLTDAMRTIKHATTETVGSTLQVESSVKELRTIAARVNTVLDRLQYE